jgi:hypothetical protein
MQQYVGYRGIADWRGVGPADLWVHGLERRHCEERSDEAIQKSDSKNWIASSQVLLAMTTE